MSQDVADEKPLLVEMNGRNQAIPVAANIEDIKPLPFRPHIIDASEALSQLCQIAEPSSPRCGKPSLQRAFGVSMNRAELLQGPARNDMHRSLMYLIMRYMSTQYEMRFNFGPHIKLGSTSSVTRLNCFF